MVVPKVVERPHLVAVMEIAHGEPMDHVVVVVAKGVVRRDQRRRRPGPSPPHALEDH